MAREAVFDVSVARIARVGEVLPAPCSPTAFAIARPVGPVPGRTAPTRSLLFEAAGRTSPTLSLPRRRWGARRKNKEARCRDVGGELGARTKRLAAETSVGSSAQEQRGSLSRRRWGARRKNKEACCRDVRGKSVARQRGGLSRRRVRVRAQEEEGALSKTPLSKSSPRRQPWGGCRQVRRRRGLAGLLWSEFPNIVGPDLPPRQTSGLISKSSRR